MNGTRPGRYQDFSTNEYNRENPRKRTIANQDEDHLNDEFLDSTPVDYTGYQTDSKPFTNAAEPDVESDFNQQDDNYKTAPRIQRKTSDPIIKEKICELLTKDKDIDASDIEVAVNQGTVVLSGTVKNRDERFRAEMAVETINGVQDIVNNLKLKKKS